MVKDQEMIEETTKRMDKVEESYTRNVGTLNTIQRSKEKELQNMKKLIEDIKKSNRYCSEGYQRRNGID